MNVIALVVVGTLALLAPDEATMSAYRASYAQESKAKYREALAELDRLPPAKRKTYVYHLRRGWLLYLLGRYWDSVSEYKAAIAVHSHAIEPRLGLMLPLSGLRLWLDVARTGKVVLATAPRNRTAHARTAWAYYNLGRFPDAQRHYESALEAFPADVEMRAGLGWALFRQGELAAARREFEAVLEIAPESRSAQDGVAAIEAAG